MWNLLTQALDTVQPSSNTTQRCDLWYHPTDENIASLQTSSAFYWEFFKVSFLFFFSLYTNEAFVEIAFLKNKKKLST